MSDYLPESRTIGVKSSVYAPTSYILASQSKTSRGLLDSIDYTQSQAKQAKLKNASVGGRATLSPPQSKPSDELTILAEAFVTAFTAMNKSISTQLNDYTQLQELDQTQTQAVLQSSRNSIAKENAAEKIAATVSDYEKKVATENEYFGWGMFGFGIALTIACFASAFITFGATAAAAPEAIEMTTELAVQTPELVENAEPAMQLSDLSDTDSDGSTVTPSSSSDTMEGIMNETARTMDRTLSQMEDNPAQEVETSLDSSDTSNGKSVAKWAARIARFIGRSTLKMGIGAVFGSPMLMKGITGLRVANKLEDVAAAQKLVGGALDTQQRNNMYFQFLQQLVQREGGVLQEEVNNASEIVDTYSSITSAYRGISYGLANAV